ncbi:hypothetical protein [Streptomyces sp. NPDC052225]|uniref:hypothetical protein n=1 Tax=Streptomyces sp. NPDC052225 TaxID=3154949 RepID=UPI00342BDEB3
MLLTRHLVLLGAAVLAWPVTSAAADGRDQPALLTVQECRARGGAPAFRVYGGGDAYRCVSTAEGAGPGTQGTDPGFAFVLRPAFDLDYLAPAECQAGGGVMRWDSGAEAGGGTQVCEGGVYDGKIVASVFEQTD